MIARMLMPCRSQSFKGVPPIAADADGFPDFRMCYFSENVDCSNFQMGFGFGEGLQSMRNGYGLQIDRFSAHFEPYGSIFDDVVFFCHFGVAFGCLMPFPEGPRTLPEALKAPGPNYGSLMLLPEDPRTLQECPEDPGTLCECPVKLVGTCLSLSELAQTCRNFSKLLRP